MSKHSSSPKFKTRLVILFYKVVMPSLMLILLLGVSSLISRPTFAGSKFIDALVRIMLSLWFVIGYIRLPNLAKKYRLYPNVEWKRSEISAWGKLFYLSLAILFGVGITLVTWWAINVFLPVLKNVSLLLAIVNGMLYIIPIARQYQVFKL